MITRIETLKGQYVNEHYYTIDYNIHDNKDWNIKGKHLTLAAFLYWYNIHDNKDWNSSMCITPHRPSLSIDTTSMITRIETNNLETESLLDDAMIQHPW